MYKMQGLQIIFNAITSDKSHIYNSASSAFSNRKQSLEEAIMSAHSTYFEAREFKDEEESKFYRRGILQMYFNIAAAVVGSSVALYMMRRRTSSKQQQPTHQQIDTSIQAKITLLELEIQKLKLMQK